MWDPGRACSGTGPGGRTPGSIRWPRPVWSAGRGAGGTNQEFREDAEEVTAVGQGRRQRTGQTLEVCVEERETLGDHQELAGAQDRGSKEMRGGRAIWRTLRLPPARRLGLHGGEARNPSLSGENIRERLQPASKQEWKIGMHRPSQR